MTTIVTIVAWLLPFIGTVGGLIIGRIYARRLLAHARRLDMVLIEQGLWIGGVLLLLAGAAMTAHLLGVGRLLGFAASCLMLMGYRIFVPERAPEDQVFWLRRWPMCDGHVFWLRCAVHLVALVTVAALVSVALR
jgi:hypothetical protein